MEGEKEGRNEGNGGKEGDTRGHYKREGGREGGTRGETEEVRLTHSCDELTAALWGD